MRKLHNEYHPKLQNGTRLSIGGAVHSNSNR